MKDRHNKSLSLNLERFCCFHQVFYVLTNKLYLNIDIISLIIGHHYSSRKALDA